MFSRMKLGVKVGISLTVAAVLVTAVGATGLLGMSSIIDKMADVSDQKFPSMHSELLMLEAQQMIERGVNASMLPNISVDHEQRREAKDLIQVGWSQLDFGRRKFEALPHSKAANEEWAAAMGPIEAWRAAVDETIKLVEERERLIDAGESSVSPEVVTLYGKAWDSWGAQAKLLVPAQAALRKLADGTIKRVELSKQAAHATEASARHLLVGVGIAGALAMLLVAAFFWRAMSRIVRSLTTEAGRLTDAVAAGQLGVRAEPAAVAFEFRGIVEGMNRTMDAFVKPIQLTAEYVDRISKGDLPPKITEEYAGDFDHTKRNLNTCIDALSQLIDDLGRMTAAHDRGEITARIDAARFEGAYASVAAGVNAMAAGHIEVNRKAMACVAEFGEGNFDAPLEKFPGQKASINETIEKVRSNLKLFLAEMGRMSGEHDRGEIDVAIDAQRFQGDFRKMASGVNDMVAGHIDVKRKAMACIAEFGKGNFEAPLERFPGKKAFINDTVEQVRQNLKAVIADVDGLARAAVAGQLSSRADASRHQNDFRKIVEGINATLDAILGPVQEATHVLEKLAQRDLRARVQGRYQGDHARIKDALNATADALHEAMSQVAEAVAQVSSAAGQIAGSSQSVADGASEQASSLQETTSSLESMSTMTKQAADNAQQANGLAQSAKAAAAEGGTAMEQMTGAMGKIKAAAQGTSQIIKDINEIAFQTNLLALNAAVEAARAGDAGRGFAVVAEEVRSLALRSKDAAMKTEQLIRESVNQAGEGETTAAHVNAKLGEITTSVTKVTDIIAEIAASAKEQAAGIEGVNKAIAQMDKVTQQNAANSEESSSAAAELSGQSEELAAMVGTFQLERTAARPAAQPGCRPASASVAAARHSQPAPALARRTALAAPHVKNGHGIPLRPEDVIPLAGDAALDEF